MIFCPGFHEKRAKKHRNKENIVIEIPIIYI